MFICCCIANLCYISTVYPSQYYFLSYNYPCIFMNNIHFCKFFTIETNLKLVEALSLELPLT